MLAIQAEETNFEGEEMKLGHVRLGYGGSDGLVCGGLHENSLGSSSGDDLRFSLK